MNGIEFEIWVALYKCVTNLDDVQCLFNSEDARAVAAQSTRYKIKQNSRAVLAYLDEDGMSQHIKIPEQLTKQILGLYDLSVAQRSR